MNDAEYNAMIEAVFTRLEESLDASELDCDFENQGSVFTVDMPGKAPLILNRHGPTQQLWLAAQSGGYHLAYDDSEQVWRCTKSAKTFAELWETVTTEQFGAAIALVDAPV